MKRPVLLGESVIAVNPDTPGVPDSGAFHPQPTMRRLPDVGEVIVTASVYGDAASVVLFFAVWMTSPKAAYDGVAHSRATITTRRRTVRLRMVFTAPVDGSAWFRSRARPLR